MDTASNALLKELARRKAEIHKAAAVDAYLAGDDRTIRRETKLAHAYERLVRGLPPTVRRAA